MGIEDMATDTEIPAEQGAVDSPVDEVVVNPDDAPASEAPVQEAEPEQTEPAADDTPLIDRLSQEEIQERIAAYDELVKVRDQHQKLVSSSGRLAQQWGEERKTLNSKLQEYEAQVQREKEEAERKSLLPYDRKHPEFDKWVRLYESARRDAKVIQSESDPDRRAIVEETLRRKYSAEEQQLISGYEDYIQQHTTDFFSNPMDWVRRAFENFAPTYFQRYTQAQQEWVAAQQGKDQWLEKNKDLVGTHREELVTLLTGGMSADQAAEFLRLKHGNKSLTGKAAKASEIEARARAQAEALGTKAKLPSGSPRHTPVADIAEGLSSDLKHEDFIDALVRRRQ
jgi:hypothetical protein